MIEYWKPSIPMFADKIRLKLDQLGCPFPSSSNSNGGFNIFGFIDNTMNAMCRPGDSLTRDGDNAPRNNPLIQRAFYNGWKKFMDLSIKLFTYHTNVVQSFIICWKRVPIVW